MRPGRAAGTPADDEVVAGGDGGPADGEVDQGEPAAGGITSVWPDEYVTIREAARYLSIPEPVLRMTVRCGKIPSRRGRGGIPLIKKKHLLPFLCPLLEGRLE